MNVVAPGTVSGGLDPWRPLLTIGAIAAIVVVVLIPIQAAVFIFLPPPSTVLEYFALFERNPLLGMLDLDLLLMLDYLVMIPFYLSLFVVIRRIAPAWALMALVAGMFSLVLYLVSREATFSMWMLSSQYSAASTEVHRAALVGTGQTLLTFYNGGSFGVSYILGAASTLLFSAVMFQHRLYGKLPGVVGIITGIMMLVPPNIGPVGVILAMLSLIPTTIWLVLLCRALLSTARTLPKPADLLNDAAVRPGLGVPQ